MAEVSDALSHSSSAFSQAKTHAQAADTSGQIQDKLKQYPSVQNLMKSAAACVPPIVDAVEQLHKALDETALESIAQAGQAGDKAKVASAGAPVSLRDLQSATSKLKKATDLSDLTAKVDAVMHDANIASAAKSWANSQSDKPDVGAIRGAIKSVNVDSIDLINQIEHAATSVQQAGHSMPADTQAVASHIQTELREINAGLKRDTAKLVQSCDHFLAALA
jgi:hypothetical protein